MTHPGPSAVPIVLSEKERAELVRRARGPGVWRADRERIVLACAEGMSNAAAAQALGVAVKSVSKWLNVKGGQRPFPKETRSALDIEGKHVTIQGPSPGSDLFRVSSETARGLSPRPRHGRW